MDEWAFGQRDLYGRPVRQSKVVYFNTGSTLSVKLCGPRFGLSHWTRSKVQTVPLDQVQSSDCLIVLPYIDIV